MLPGVDYLRVLTPVTTDGVNLKYANGQPVYREDHLPVTSEKMIEKKNMQLPEHLRKKIEYVSSYNPPQRSEQPVNKKTKA